MNTKVFIGAKFGKLTVIEKLGQDKHGRRIWLCQCECGNIKPIVSCSLTNGLTKSCGCSRSVTEEEKALAIIFHNIEKRCYYPYAHGYANYGGRGITICKEWERNMPAFREWALNNGYKLGLSIDRIDPDGNYEPSNCRWVTLQDQLWNKRNTVRITYNGETHTLKEWSEKTGIPSHTIKYRLKKGLPIEEVLTKPSNRKRKDKFTYKGETHTLSEWAQITGKSISTLYARIYDKHWDIEKALTS